MTRQRSVMCVTKRVLSVSQLSWAPTPHSSHTPHTLHTTPHTAHAYTHLTHTAAPVVRLHPRDLIAPTAASQARGKPPRRQSPEEPLRPLCPREARAAGLRAQRTDTDGSGQSNLQRRCRGFRQNQRQTRPRWGDNGCNWQGEARLTQHVLQDGAFRSVSLRPWVWMCGREFWKQAGHDPGSAGRRSGWTVRAAQELLAMLSRCHIGSEGTLPRSQPHGVPHGFGGAGGK